MKTIERSEIVSLSFWATVGKVSAVLIGMIGYFALAGWVTGYMEKAQLRDAVIQGVIEACDNGATCIIKLDK